MAPDHTDHAQRNQDRTRANAARQEHTLSSPTPKSLSTSIENQNSMSSFNTFNVNFNQGPKDVIKETHQKL